MRAAEPAPTHRGRSWQQAPAAPPEPVQTKRSAAMLGVAAMLTAVVGLGIWMGTVPLASAVVASGKVSVASKRKEIQHLDGGIIKAIHVRDGSVVTEGSILFELDETRAKARYMLTRSAYFASLAARARLVAERDRLDAMAVPAELASEGRQSADVEQVVENQRRIFEGRREELAGQAAVGAEKIAQLKEEIAGLEAERASAERQSELVEKERVVIEELFERGYTNRQRLYASRRESTQLAGNLGRLGAAVAKARKEISETELSIRQLRLKRHAEVVAELKDVEQRLFDLKETYQAAHAELTRLSVTAPVNGVVLNSVLNTIGGVVRPGQTVLEIVPNSDVLIVEARVRPLDIDEVSTGQSTEVRLAAFKQRTTPSLGGVVANVAADALSDPRTGEPYYSVIVSIPREELQRLGAEHRLQPGMPAEILIKTGQRTSLRYLLQPLLDSAHRGWREQ